MSRSRWSQKWTQTQTKKAVRTLFIIRLGTGVRLQTEVPCGEPWPCRRVLQPFLPPPPTVGQMLCSLEVPGVLAAPRWKVGPSTFFPLGFTYPQVGNHLSRRKMSWAAREGGSRVATWEGGRHWSRVARGSSCPLVLGPEHPAFGCGTDVVHQLLVLTGPREHAGCAHRLSLSLYLKKKKKIKPGGGGKHL